MSAWTAMALSFPATALSEDRERGRINQYSVIDGLPKQSHHEMLAAIDAGKAFRLLRAESEAPVERGLAQHEDRVPAFRDRPVETSANQCRADALALCLRPHGQRGERQGAQ